MKSRFRHGLVLGKFYPPHAGHHLLVDTAARQCELLTVLVCSSDVESIPLELRAAWMREVHPQPNVRIAKAVDNVPIDFESSAIWDAHMAVFRSALPPGQAIDAVFTSEAYGDELARRFQAAHISIRTGSSGPSPEH
jgi:cytidyltransferase-like protein